MDRYGFQPLYRYGDVTSSSIFDFPASELDYDALSVFIRLGFFVGNSTAFKSIKHAGPDPWVTKPSHMSRSAAIDHYGELFRTAIRRLMPADEITLPLSGGRDSRHILFELNEAGIKPLTVTLRHWVPTPNDDLKIARILADQFGLKHTALGTIWPSVSAEHTKNELTDFCADEHAWLLPIRTFMEQHGGVAFDGIAGDILSAGLYLHRGFLEMLERGNTAAAADLLLGTEDKWEAILAPSLYKNLSRERASAQLQAELMKHVNAPNPVSSYLFWNRTRRETSLFGFRMLGDLRMPYIDDAVYDHLTSLPPSYFLDQTFHTETINRMFPQHAGIPFDSKTQTRLGRWLFKLSALKAEAHRLMSRSKWIENSFLNLKTKPDDVARVLYLLQLERFIDRATSAQPNHRGNS